MENRKQQRRTAWHGGAAPGTLPDMTTQRREKRGKMKNDIVLRPSYWASVSGGKDSLYMLKLILSNPDKYPLDGVVHFELEIDYPFIKNVIDYMESECKRAGVKFLRIKPRKSWYDLLEENGFPTRVCRWCNTKYKLDAQRQLVEMLKSQGLKCIHYIGYCADEKKRFEKRKENGITEIYPLVDYDIQEHSILEWAKNVDLFNDFYKYMTRCGCMFCPMITKIELAYLFKYYPDEYNFLIEIMKREEKRLTFLYGRKISVTSGNPKYNAEYLDNITRTKWLPKLEKMLQENANIIVENTH